MPTEIEGTHEIGPVSLYKKHWKPDGPAVARLIFIHGFNDHINRYYELFPTLASRSIETFAFDQRGWGQSVKTSSDKGKTGTTEQVIADVAHFVKAHLSPVVPVFVMGHSMGGGEVLTLASDPQYEDLVKEVRGWLLESPFIAFPKGFEPNPIEAFVGKLVSRVLPAMQRFSALPAETVTRDPEVIKSINEDKLLHGSGTLQGLTGMLNRTQSLGNGTAKLSKNVKSLWLAHGTADQGTSYDGSKEWFERHKEVEDATFKTYEEWTHQLHADMPENRPVFAKDVGDWILARVGDAKPAGDSKL